MMLSALAWLALLVCLVVIFLQLIPWIVDLGRQSLDWWDFQLGSGKDSTSSSNRLPSESDLFARPANRILYVLVLISLAIGASFASKLLGTFVISFGLALPILVKWRSRAKQRLALEQALPDAMSKLAALVSAGQPIHQAMIELPERVDAALSPCFSYLRTDLKLGISLSDALKRQERRIDLEEFVAFASCVRVGLSSGGTLAPSIERLARDMRTRLNLKAKLRVLTVQARGQAWIMATLPVVILGAISVVDPGGFDFLTRTDPGRSALGLAFGMNLLGAWWVRRLAQSKWV